MSRCVSIVYRRVSVTKHLYRDSDTCHRDRSTVQRDIRFCHRDRLSPRPETNRNFTMAVLYIGPSPRGREIEERNDRRENGRKKSKQTQAAPNASTVGPCPTIFKISRTPYNSTIVPPDPIPPPPPPLRIWSSLENEILNK